MSAAAKAGPSRGPDAWRPTKYLEPLHPDNEEVLEQAAYQAAVTRLGGDNRGTRRYKPRRTVDFQGGVIKWRQVSGIALGPNSSPPRPGAADRILIALTQLAKMKGLPDYLPTIHPNPSDLIGVSTAGGSGSIQDQFKSSVAHADLLFSSCRRPHIGSIRPHPSATTLSTPQSTRNVRRPGSSACVPDLSEDVTNHG